MPPLVTASWLRANNSCLTDEQVNGGACCYCARETKQMVPVGRIGRRQLFACLPACEAAHGSNRP